MTNAKIKIVINTCYGGFGLAPEVIELYEMVVSEASSSTCSRAFRSDPVLISIIEEFGIEKAGAHFAELKIVEIPADVNWEIREDDGLEMIWEVSRSWG